MEFQDGELGGLYFPLQPISQDRVSLGIMELEEFELESTLDHTSK